MYYFIINPNSQSGKSMKLWKKIKKEMPECRYVFTRYPGHMTTIVNRLTRSKTAKHLIIVGGDGSFNEAVNGLQNSHLHKLTFFPAGSGNDLARSLHLPSDPKQLYSLLNQCQNNDMMKPIDLGQVTVGKKESSHSEKKRTRTFAVSSGIGFDAAICQKLGTSSWKKRFNQFHLGKLAYLFTGIRLLLSWKPKKACLWIDQETSPVVLNRFLFLSAHIQPYEGGGFPFCPDADCHDRKLDLCVVSGLPVYKVFRLIPLAKFGRHINEPGVQIIRCHQARLVLEEPLYLHTDGEVIGKEKSVGFTVSPDQYQMGFTDPKALS